MQKNSFPKRLKADSIHWKTPLRTHQTLLPASTEERISLSFGVPPSCPAALREAQTLAG